MKTAKQLVETRKLNRYQHWHNGKVDRLDGKPCSSTNGDYLNGYYSPDAIIPDFLTHNEASNLRKHLKHGN